MRVFTFFLIVLRATEVYAQALRIRIVGGEAFAVRNEDLICVRWSNLRARPALELKPGATAARKLAELTKKSVGKRMQIIKDGRVLPPAAVLAPVTKGALGLSGRFGPKEVQELARDIGERQSG